MSDFTKKVAGSNGLIGNPHINKTDIELAMLFVCQISSEAYVDRNEPIAIPAGCEQRETQMKTSFPEYELAAPLAQNAEPSRRHSFALYLF